MTWTCLNEASARACRGHRYYVEDQTDRIAVADWSMRLKDRPDTTDDGLLILDHQQAVIVQTIGIMVPVIKYAGQSGQYICDTHKQLAELLPIFERAGMAVTVQETFAGVVRLLVPYVEPIGESK